MGLNILYIAVHKLNAGWGAETFLAAGFEQLGHNVIRVDYRAHRAELPKLLAEAALEKPDIVLLQRGENFPVSLLSNFKSPKVYYATEAAWNPDQREIIVSRAFDGYVALSQTTLNYMIHQCKISKTNAWLIPSGFDNQIYQKVDYEKIYNVIAVCNWSFRRHKAFVLLKFFTRNTHKFHGIYGKACNDLVNQSYITLNIHGTDVLDTETRLFELLPTSTAIVSEDCDIPDLFKDSGIQWFSKGDWKTMRKLVHKLLNDHEFRAVCIKKNNLLAPSHTWQARSQVFTTLFENLLGRAG